jgi:hypothetical protein
MPSGFHTKIKAAFFHYLAGMTILQATNKYLWQALPAFMQELLARRNSFLFYKLPQGRAVLTTS